MKIKHMGYRRECNEYPLQPSTIHWARTRSKWRCIVCHRVTMVSLVDRTLRRCINPHCSKSGIDVGYKGLGYHYED